MGRPWFAIDRPTPVCARRPPSAAPHVQCSGPVQLVRSLVCPSIHRDPGAIQRERARHTVAWHSAFPCSTSGAHLARSARCSGP